MPKRIDIFEKYDLDPPTTQAHGSDRDIASQLQRLKANKWYLRGNELVMETDWGPVVQRIPTDYVCDGIDSAGLPKLRKIAL